MLLFARIIRIAANVSILQKGQVDEGSILFAVFKELTIILKMDLNKLRTINVSQTLNACFCKK